MNRQALRRGAVLGVLAGAVACLVSFFDPTFFGAEWLLRDAFTRKIAASRKPDPRIVIVAINDKSIASLADLYGRPPYSRAIYATVLDELRQAGVAVVAFDILFTEENGADPAGDRAFAAALQGAPVVLGAQTTRPKNATQPGGADDPRFWTVTGIADPRRFVPTIPLFREAGGIGTIRIAAATHDASIHAYAPFDRIRGNRFLPSLAAETARQFLQLPRLAERRGELLTLGTANSPHIDIPIDAQNEMAIRWSAGETGQTADASSKTPQNHLHYHTVDFDKLVLVALSRTDASAGITPEQRARFDVQFRGCVVLFGYTSAGLFDLRATPLSPIAPGVEIHANAIDNLINRRFDRAAEPWLSFPLILLLGMLAGAAIYATHRQWLAALATLIAAALVAILGHLALQHGLIVPTVAALAGLALTYIAVTVVRFVAEQEQTAMLKTTFGRYVSPQILDHIIAHPEKVQLGGERRDLTILFSDIRGFTSISEASEPEQVVEMLNEYLTRMVEILLEHGGTLDKFIGDAVMGFWNAPAFDPDHPTHAVSCALEMIEETAKLRERWIAEGKAELRIGIGINTGDAVVGNIGAEKVFGYTVIGDAVNLASRLEGKNKDYKTEIIISEFTLARIGDAFETVYLDDVKVKGKENAVKIYEVRHRR